MQNHRRVDEYRREGTDADGAGIDDSGVVWSRRYAKSILLKAYLECLNAVCHSKQRDGSAPTLQTKLVKMLTSKTKITARDEAYKFCLELWDELSLALIDPQGSSVMLPSKKELIDLQGHEVLIRLALLADFYRYQKEDLALNEEESMDKLCAIRAEALGFIRQRVFTQPRMSHPTTATHLSNRLPIQQIGGYVPPTRESDTDSCLSLRGAGAPITPHGCVATGVRVPSTKGFSKTHKLKPGSPGSPACITKFERGWKIKNKRNVKTRGIDQKNETLCSKSTKQLKRGEDSIRWSRFSFSTRRKPYYVKLIRAFQVVKSVGHPMLTLNSEWGLSCYYKLAVAYTTDQPLELAAKCIPELHQALDIIHAEQFQKLTELKLTCQMLLYAVLNCHINWVDHNHKQIILMPGKPSSHPPLHEGDLRCSRCLKNQTFHSSEVKGNPRNIDVEFDFEQMKFGSSCCAAPMINVPLSTRDVNTCTFTEMKQMYTSCIKCRQPIFSEVLVDAEALYSRCVVCMAKGL